ncbi:hypothetical protein GB937_010415 [Aspergillus fischeri]|nr:hypothetical protein GB937_010415 [Aspergillus fischeri]
MIKALSNAAHHLHAGYTFAELAALAYMPDPVQEPILQLWTESLDAVVDQAIQSLSDHRVNAFDHARINSFIDDAYRRPSHRPIFYHLQPSTNQRYRRIWKRLLCFVYRMAQPNQPVRPAHILTEAQADLLQQMVELGQRLQGYTASATATVHAPDPPPEDAARVASAALNRTCLLFCISLLDHVLRRDLFESVVVGFLAILNVDERMEDFRGAHVFTPILSGFIKIGQLLVIQRAVLAVEEGTVDEPSSILNEMRQRFLVHGCATPVGWALRLRTYGKKIKIHQMPVLPGHVDWSDDGNTLSYRGQNLHMVDFQRFTHSQVEMLQSQLNGLLLQTLSSSPPPIPQLHLSELHDDHAHPGTGWNLLRDPRNKTQLAGHERWVIDCIIADPLLREQFIEPSSERNRLTWKKQMATEYLTQVDQFLERLLIVCHLTSGQPARGTEILSLRHVNTWHGQHRGIFVENGLVGLVTAYHKGYHMTCSTCLIHRYLPERASKILVYYLWPVHPFQQQLRTLAFQDATPMSPFLWPPGAGGFTSDRLSKALRREFQQCLDIRITLADYRHVANAISTTAPSRGRVPERNEAPGHLEARRWEYRVVSRGWHHLLGFTDNSTSTKRTPADLDLDDVRVDSIARLDLHGPPLPVCRHLRDRHHSHPTAATVALCQAALTEMLKRPWIDPSQEAGPLPPGGPPVEGLPVYRGYGCPHCPYVCRTARSLQDHRRRNHQEQDGHCGRGRQPVKLAQARARNRLADRVVHCQRFFPSGPRSSFFTVCPDPGPGGPGTQGPRAPRGMAMTPGKFARAEVDQLLGEGLQEASDQNIVVPEHKHPTDVSPWLELTRWPEYLRGQELGAVAELGTLPDPTREPLLEVFAASVARLIQCAYCTIRDHRINEFDQIQINTFFRKPGVWNRPIQIHLRPSTYRQYRQVWQRLVCFAYRSTRPDQAIQLRHRLTTAQMAALDEMEVYGTQWLQLEETGATQMAEDEGAVRREQAEAKQVLTRLDRACLALSIALLDHPLKGDLFESTPVGFLAILGVDVARQTFRDPYYYTTFLSGLVKMAEMLVAERAVRLAEEPRVTHPADALDEMRERFLLYRVRAPFGWITRLRTYGKKIQNNHYQPGLYLLER